MLRYDDREECLADRLGLELLHPEKIEILVSVLRGEGDEAAFGEARCEGLVGIKVGLPGHVLGRAFEPVLADDDGTLFTREEVEVFWQGQNAVGDHLFATALHHIHEHFVGQGLVSHLIGSGADVWGEQGQFEIADHLGAEFLSVGLDRFPEVFERVGFEIGEVTLPVAGRFDEGEAIVEDEFVGAARIFRQFEIGGIGRRRGLEAEMGEES